MVCVRTAWGDESICVSTNMNMFSWRLSLYRCVLCLSVCSRESMRHICVFFKVRASVYVCVCVWVCVHMCKQLASLPVVLCKQKWRYSGWGYEVGGGVWRGWMRLLVPTVKNTPSRTIAAAAAANAANARAPQHTLHQPPISGLIWVAA